MPDHFGWEGAFSQTGATIGFFYIIGDSDNRDSFRQRIPSSHAVGTELQDGRCRVHPVGFFCLFVDPVPLSGLLQFRLAG